MTDIEDYAPEEIPAVPPEVLRALYVASIKAWAVSEEDITRAVAGRYRTAPGKDDYRAASGEKLGYLQRTDPPPHWAVTDGKAFDEHLAADPDNVATEENLDPPSADELVALVREHRPEWLQPVTYVKPEARKAALAKVRETGKPCPGVTLEREASRLIVKADPGSREVFARMIRAGDILPDGTTPEVEPVRRRPEVETRLPELGHRITTRMKDEADDAYDRGDPWAEPVRDPFAGAQIDPFADIEIDRSAG